MLVIDEAQRLPEAARIIKGWAITTQLAVELPCTWSLPRWILLDQAAGSLYRSP